MRCVVTELLCALGSHVEGAPLETEVLPRVLRMAADEAYLVRKVGRTALEINPKKCVTRATSGPCF